MDKLLTSKGVPKVHRTLLAIAISTLLLAVVASLTVGVGSLDDPQLRSAFLAIRGARLGASLLLGAALATAGVLVQGLFRNPLADPGLIGTTAGAVLGGKLALVALEFAFGAGAWSGLAPELWVSIGSVVGAGSALLCLLLLMRRSSSVLVLLLVGFSLSSLFASMGGVLSTVAERSWELGRALSGFALGSVAGVSSRHLLLTVGPIVIGFFAAYRLAPSLDVLLYGEEEASALGLDVSFVRRWACVWVAVLTGAAVALGGFVGFVGLIVPHALRPFLGAEHARLLPYAAIFGAVFVALADVCCRFMPGGTEIPLGVVTGLVGAPLFLRLLIQSQRERGLDG
jgi:iron complex transport system permease protein